MCYHIFTWQYHFLPLLLNLYVTCYTSLHADDETVGKKKDESNKRKSGDNLKEKAPPAKMKFSLGSKPKAAPLKISLGKPQV